ncbi:MAG: glycosyltransferase [Clostridia bacterium]|nr:glycosyltransferase [Clostridia bacterium]
MTKFAYDLMLSQKVYGHEVIAIWPGKINVINSKTKIEIDKEKRKDDILSYEIVNPLPVPLDEGVRNISLFMKKCNKDIYMSFLEKICPDVIHIHTLMGLHSEFIESAKELKIRTVYTTHDYFGICPKVTLFRNNMACAYDNDCKYCVKCNENALSFNEIKILQSHMYKKLKNTRIVKLLRKKHRSNFFICDNQEESRISDNAEEKAGKEYIKLRKYYINMLENIDIIHYNSQLTKEVYSKYFTPKESKVVTLSHKDIIDNRKSINWKYSGQLKLTYLGPLKNYKGFGIIKTALDELISEGKHNFILNMYAEINNPSSYMKIIKEGYSYEELPQIMKNSDIVLVPSVCYETFGYTVLESLSYGVPVIVSENVGAKEIVSDGGIVIKANSVEELKEVIKSLDKEKLLELHKNVINDIKIKTFEEFTKEMENLYKGK